ncbi:MAG: transposase [Planctomycetes bacterium]|nr:transposase [Planctomycetota bacterium]
MRTRRARSTAYPRRRAGGRRPRSTPESCRAAPRRGDAPGECVHGIQAVIPRKEYESLRRDQRAALDKVTYRRRAVVEQCVGWMKECRRIGTRFDKPAVNFQGMLQLAMTRRYLKLLLSDRA